jgi:hypothetical protein
MYPLGTRQLDLHFGFRKLFCSNCYFGYLEVGVLLDNEGSGCLGSVFTFYEKNVALNAGLG